VTAYSCVVDDVPKIWKSIVPWLATTTELAGVAPENLYVHHVCELPSWLARLCDDLGVNTRPVERFDSEDPYANKIRQHVTDFGSNDRVVLSDVDIAFVQPFPIEELGDVVAGKPVDLPNPPIGILHRIFERAGIEPMQTCTNVVMNGDAEIAFETLVGNFNGGIYIVPLTKMAALGAGWAKWGRWLGERREILLDWREHLDQVSFCLSINEERVPARILDDRWNYPAHLAVRPLTQRPFAIHHHAMLEDDHSLRFARDPLADAGVRLANRAIRGFRIRHGIA
jgi:hypothetical protein